MQRSFAARAVRRRQHEEARKRYSSPWLVSHALFFSILLLRLTSGNFIPLWLVFAPVWISSVTLLLVKVSDFYLLLRNRLDVSQSLTYRVNCAVYDQLGHTFTVFLIFLYVISIIPSAMTVCAPLVVVSSFSLYQRVINLPPLHSRVIGHLFLTAAGNCVVHLLMGIVQPVLIAIKIDHVLNCSWFFIAIPLWLLCLLYTLSALVLYRFSCSLHARSNPLLRFQAAKLTVLCATQILIVALSCLISSIWFVLSLEFHDVLSRRDFVIVLSPIIFMFAALSYFYPLTLSSATRYHEMLYFAGPILSALSNMSRMELKPNEETTWLIQETNSVFKQTSLAALGINMSEIDAKSLLRTISFHIDDSVEEGVNFRHFNNDDLERCDYLHGSDEKNQSLLVYAPHLETKGEQTTVLGTGSDDTFHESFKCCELVKCFENQFDPLSRDTKELEFDLCFVCCSNPSNACLLDCGHGNICYECAQAVAKKDSSSCPMCRRPISRIVKISKSIDTSRLQNTTEAINRSSSFRQHQIFYSEEGMSVCMRQYHAIT